MSNRRPIALLAALAVAACDGSAESDTAVTSDSAAVTTNTAAGQTSPTADSGMAGMDHSNMAGMNRSAPRDSNQAFLRMMSDHHEGLIVMADSAGARLQGATAKGDARKLRGKQDEEQNRMLSMLSREYGDSVTPMIMPSNRAMLDSVLAAPQGAEADRVFYRQVVAHHREGIAHTEMHMPHLTGEVKRMAEKMRTEHQREIAEMERKAQRGS